MIDFNDPAWPKKFFSEQIPDFENFLSAFKEKIESLPSAARLTDHEIDLIYSMAYSFFQQGKIEIANSLFHVLLFYRPGDQRLLSAYAISCKKAGDYENASLNFLFLFMLNPSELKYVQHFAECLSANGNEQLALETVESILNCPSINLPENETVLVRSKVLKNMLGKSQNATEKKLH